MNELMNLKKKKKLIDEFMIYKQGTSYVYETFFRPYIERHESEIDRTLLELRTRAADFAVSYCQKAATYGQTRFFEVLQFIASQKQSQPKKAQQPNEVVFE